MLDYDLSARGDSALYDYLYQRIRDDIMAGAIAAGQRLPSKRALAQHLGVSVVTVEGAYAQLAAEGYVRSRPRSGYFACELPVGEGMPVPTSAPVAACEAVDDGADLTSSASFSGDAARLWARALRQTLSSEPEGEVFAPAPAQGSMRLRRAIAGSPAAVARACGGSHAHRRGRGRADARRDDFPACGDWARVCRRGPGVRAPHAHLRGLRPARAPRSARRAGCARGRARGRGRLARHAVTSVSHRARDHDRKALRAAWLGLGARESLACGGRLRLRVQDVRSSGAGAAERGRCRQRHLHEHVLQEPGQCVAACLYGAAGGTDGALCA